MWIVILVVISAVVSVAGFFVYVILSDEEFPLDDPFDGEATLLDTKKWTPDLIAAIADKIG